MCENELFVDVVGASHTFLCGIQDWCARNFTFAGESAGRNKHSLGELPFYPFGVLASLLKVNSLAVIGIANYTITVFTDSDLFILVLCKRVVS